MKLHVLPGLNSLMVCLVGSLMLTGTCFAEELNTQQRQPKQSSSQAQPVIDDLVMQDAEKFILEMQQKMMLENQKLMQPKIQQAIQEKMQKSVKPNKLAGNQDNGRQRRGKN